MSYTTVIALDSKQDELSTLFVSESLLYLSRFHHSEETIFIQCQEMNLISIKYILIRNSREFFIRRTRETFKDNKGLTDAKAIQQQFDAARENLNIIKRQVKISASGSIL